MILVYTILMISDNTTVSSINNTILTIHTWRGTTQRFIHKYLIDYTLYIYICIYECMHMYIYIYIYVHIHNKNHIL